MNNRKLEIPDGWEPGGHKIYKFLCSQILLQYEWRFYGRVYCCDCSIKAYMKGFEFEGWLKILRTPNGKYVIYFYNQSGKTELRSVRNIKPKDLVITLRANLDGEGDIWQKIKKLYNNK